MSLVTTSTTITEACERPGPVRDLLESALTEQEKRLVERMEQAQALAEGRTPVSHYMTGGIECIDVMRAIATPAEFAAHCRLTAFKYLWRLGRKGPALADAKKAEDYIRWMREALEEVKE